ncbi:hypothetical protein PNOK_0170300 [Pyrrhoderma noxium]|uniref:Uncharacterized protein n=1 Tax=Pyrrhoderma noxium TaxID=2282107 RepID=A0A286UQ75_9AGAM|nr:hypothetical protein PNOK_0170300 [Pyrrhoderma noxium]
MSNNPASPKKVAPNNPRTQNTKSHEQQPSKPASASASVSVTKSVSSSHSRDSTPLKSSPRPKTLTSPRNSTPQRDLTPQRDSTPQRGSTPRRDDTSQRSSAPTNKKPVTQVVGDRTTSGSTPVREVPKEVKKSVTPEPVNSPRPLSSGFTPIKSNKPTARPVSGKTPKLRPVTRTLEPEDTSKPELPLSPKRQVSGDDTKDSNKKSKSASDHSATTTASKTRVTLTPTTSTSSAEKKTVTPKAKVTTTDKAPTSGQAESSENDTAAEETPKIVCENCQAKFHRKDHDIDGDDIPDEGLRFCSYKSYSNHHRAEHKGSEIQPRRASKK